MKNLHYEDNNNGNQNNVDLDLSSSITNYDNVIDFQIDCKNKQQTVFRINL